MKLNTHTSLHVNTPTYTHTTLINTLHIVKPFHSHIRTHTYTHTHTPTPTHCSYTYIHSHTLSSLLQHCPSQPHHDLPRDTLRTTRAVSVVLVSPPLTVVAVRGDLDWDVAVPTVVLVTVEAPAVERAVFVPGIDRGVWREVCMVKTLLEDSHWLYVQ